MELVKKMGISERLQEERKDLGLTQEAMAGKLGATKRSVINWEGGAALPGAEVLAGYAAAGADVLYILTGQRSGDAAVVPVATPALDAELLADAIKVVEQLLAKTGRTFTPAKKAKHVVALYQAFSSGSDAGASAVTEALTRAA